MLPIYIMIENKRLCVVPSSIPIAGLGAFAIDIIIRAPCRFGRFELISDLFRHEVVGSRRLYWRFNGNSEAVDVVRQPRSVSRFVV
jgi:hypothetical protein